MESQVEKVYVAVGNDKQESLGALEWALRNWASQDISIVILYVVNTSRNFVNTPFGKLPASAVNEEKLEVLRMCEQEEVDKFLSKYLALCGKVKAEIIKIDKPEDSIHKGVVGLISKLQITKLVMAMTFMKSSQGKSKGAISGCFYVHKHKPNFCQLFIICGGKIVFLKEEKEGYIEDDQGTMVAKTREKGGLMRSWFGRILPDSPGSYATPNSERSQTPQAELTEPLDQWANHAQEIENYVEFVSRSNDEDPYEEESNASSNSPIEQLKLEGTDSNMSASDKIECMKAMIVEARRKVEEKKKEKKANIERRSKADWMISMCNERAQELETLINEEIAKQIDLRRELETVREQLYEVSSDVKESQSRLSSVLELQSELANKLRFSSSAKSQAESELQRAVIMREETLKEIEELRKQKDVLQQRMEFCRERDAIARATTLNFYYREFTADEIREAAENFSDCSKLKLGSECSNTFKGRINRSTLAIKMQTSLSQEEFQAKMELLCRLRHPHLVSMIGACHDPKCIVYEYMHNGTLHEHLYSSHRRNCRKRGLPWRARVRISAQICSALGFLHVAKPRPIVHGDVRPSNVLLDRNMVAKLANLGVSGCVCESDVRSDVRGFGLLMLQLLTGREQAEELVDEVRRAVDGADHVGLLDDVADVWPSDVAETFARVAIRCIDGTAMREIHEMLGRLVREVWASGEGHVDGSEWVDRDEEYCDAPRIFFCPILQEVMENPHVAADGFSYELRAIEEWLGTKNERSPMTNLKLKHKVLTPNLTLRSLINDWRNKSRMIGS
ncbi:hypothetical protein Syun_004910 [Stephania yunnanensis]|uniref:RING-type E3 ubiquitin transferase n=1 Tax=Stephania yunnanensis TaxID=152371 RepID=A0AAP0L3W8_9MAGN